MPRRWSRRRSATPPFRSCWTSPRPASRCASFRIGLRKSDRSWEEEENRKPRITQITRIGTKETLIRVIRVYSWFPRELLIRRRVNAVDGSLKVHQGRLVEHQILRELLAVVVGQAEVL